MAKVKVSEVLQEARYKLTDETKERWSDGRLISLLNMGLNEIALKTKLFNRTFYLKLVDNENYYDLSEKILRIDRVQYQTETALPFVSHDYMDRNYNNWEEKYGNEITKIIYNEQDPARIKVYPIPQGTKNFNIDSNQNFGIITAIYTSEVEPVVEEDFGDINPVDLRGFLKIYGVKRQPQFTELDLDAEIDMTHTIKNAIAFYIAAQATFDNTDSVSTERAQSYMISYEKNIGMLRKDRSDNAVEADVGIRYNGMGAL